MGSPSLIVTPGKPAAWKPDPPTKINRDLSLLHPIFRACINEVLIQLSQDGLPFAVFEGFRSPQRQTYLYGQGRSRPGKIITNAEPWTSYHQFGLAADFAFLVDGKWAWDINGFERAWKHLQEVGEFYGLEGISLEQAHLQLSGLRIHELRAGSYPSGGDSIWWENLQRHLGKSTG
jgi:peptidoglycan LD-endopeptidase CwlK